jgi:hypothetical protein
VLNNENINKDMFMNSGVMNPPYGTQGAAAPQKPMTPMMPMTPMAPMMQYQMVYPEIYYKLQPYIMMVCDQIDTFGPMMPTQDMVENITDSIYDDVCRMYPDLEEYAHSKEDNANTQPAVETARFGRDPGPFGRRFRRRGVFRDFIDVLLLSELFGRRRRFY